MTRWPHLEQGELDDATNILLVAPEVSHSVETLFSELLLSVESTPEHVVGVTMSKSPWDFLEPWRRSFPRGEASFSFVSTNTVSRSVAADTSGETATESDVTRIDDVTPVTAFGRTIADQLDDENSTETAICFHSLTDLLEYVEMETACNFLDIVLSQVRTNGARAVYHIDGDVHDEETITQLSMLFDLVVEFGRNRSGRGEDGGTRGSP